MPTLTLIGGPYGGWELRVKSAPDELHVWLDAKGQLFADEGEVASVEVYVPQERGGTAFRHERSDATAAMLARAQSDLSRGMRDVMTRKLYETPDYAVYSVQPTDHHPQVEIRYEHRYAAVDERIAPLVLEAWKRGWETMGSCQEGALDSKHAGQAYLDFPDPGHGRAFAAALRAASIAVEEGVTGLLISSRRPYGFVTCHLLGKMLVYLPSADIERATAALQAG